MKTLGRLVKRNIAKEVVNSLIDDLEEADQIMERVVYLGEEAYLNKLKEGSENKDFINLGACTLLADDWIRKLEREKE